MLLLLLLLLLLLTNKQTNTVAFSPQVNYSEWAIAIGRQILVQTFVDRGVSRGQRGGTSTAINLNVLDRSRYFFRWNSPSFILMRLNGPRSRPATLQKIW
jgi:hypothetical protein